MKNTYSPKEFGRLIGRTTNTLQRWDRQGILKAHRTPTNRRYYTHNQYNDKRFIINYSLFFKPLIWPKKI
jgi:DNA-binding transcriptional MerR regulator